MVLKFRTGVIETMRDRGKFFACSLSMTVFFHYIFLLYLDKFIIVMGHNFIVCFFFCTNTEFVQFYRRNVHRTSSVFGEFVSMVFFSFSWGRFRYNHSLHISNHDLLNSLLSPGAIFWGALFSFVGLQFLIYILVGLGVLIYLQILTNFTGSLIAIILLSGLKLIVLWAISRRYYKGFYRSKNPALVNIFNLAMECWDLGLTAAYVILRGIKLAIVSIIFIGRLDVPLLSKEANRASCICEFEYVQIISLFHVSIF